jgi:hypothetical protein
MIDMGDDGYVSYIFSGLFHIFLQACAFPIVSLVIKPAYYITLLFVLQEEGAKT